MKKLLIALLAVTTLSLSSCSKDQTINRQLDGSWTATKVDGQDMPSGSSLEYTFSKDKKGKGTGTMNGTGFYSAFSNVSFSYVIADEKITMTTSNTSFSATYTVSDHSKTEMTLTDMSDNSQTVLKAK